MKVLILSCNTGEGHNSAGKALMQQFQQQQIPCTMKDALEFSSKRTSNLVVNVHAKGVRYLPWIYNIGNTMAHKLSRPHGSSICYQSNKTYAKSLHRHIVQQGYNVVISTHVFAAEALTSIRRKQRPNLLTAFVATDYCCAPFVCETDADLYFTPHSYLEEDFAARGVPRRKLRSCGIPVAEQFAGGLDKMQARDELGLSHDEQIVLIMGGSMGLGNMDEMIEQLLLRLPYRSRLVVMGGNNEKMKKQLRENWSLTGRVEVLDFTGQVSTYMDAADILLSKPGGLSSTEAAVKGIPIIHTAAMPGWEELNCDFFQQLGLSLKGDSAERAASHAAFLLRYPEKRQQMISRQRKMINRYAATDICQTVIDEYAKRSAFSSRWQGDAGGGGLVLARG